MSFDVLVLSPELLRAVADQGYTEPTPVQREAIPLVLAGRDLLAGAQTGTGKTAAFVLPILQHLAAAPSPPLGIRALILTPTRELASQIADRVAAYGRHLRLRHTVVYGGVSQHRQEIALRGSPDIVVATPGRLLDLMQQRLVRLDGVTHFVLDEADRMLDLGFFPDIRKVVAKLTKERQTLLFSATMPADIRELAQSILRHPVNVHVAPVATMADRIEQAVYHVAKRNKPMRLRKG